MSILFSEPSFAAALATWSPFQYAINWHPDQVVDWYQEQGIEPAPNMVPVIAYLEQHGWIWLASPNLSKHIWRIHPQLDLWLKRQAHEHSTLQQQQLQAVFYVRCTAAAETIHELLVAQEAEKRAVGMQLAEAERYNLQKCLVEALASERPFLPLFTVIFMHLSMQDRLNAGLYLVRNCLSHMERKDKHTFSAEEKVEWAGVMDAIGRTLREQKDSQQAETWFAKMEAWYAEDDAMVRLFAGGLGEVYRQRGIIRGERGDFQASAHYFDQARAIFSDAGDIRGIALVAENQARLFFDMHRLKEALEAVERALERAVADGDEIRKVNALQIKAGILYGLERYEESRQLYQACVEAGEKLGQTYTVAKAHQGLGLLESVAKYFKSSLPHYHQALSLLLAMPTALPFDVARIYHNMANDYYYLEEYWDSETYYRRAFDSYQQLNIQDKMAEAAQGLANVWYFLGDFVKSRAFDVQAAGLYAAVGRRKEVMEILENAMTLGQETNDKQVVLDILDTLSQYFPATECREMLATILQKIDAQ